MAKIKPLSRRTLLRGVGTVALSLPFLEAMLPTRQSYAHGGGPRRFAGVFVPNGFTMNLFVPSAEGAGYDLPQVLSGISAVQDEVSVLSGLSAVSNGVGAHAQTTGSAFTGSPVGTANAELYNTTSIDQAYARLVGDQTPLSSLVLGVREVANAADDAGYPDVYHRHISWDGSTPMARVDDVATAFSLVFGDVDPNAPDELLLRQQQLRLSILDGVLDEASALNAKLGASDRRKVDEYLTSVRDLESRVVAEDVTSDSGCAATAPRDLSNDETRVDAMLELIAMAFACDQTRAATFCMGRSFSSLDFRPLFGWNEHWHSHNNTHTMGGSGIGQAAVTAREHHNEIGHWELQRFAAFIDRLRNIDEGGSSVLDNSAIVLTSDVSNGHSHGNMPVLLAGSAGGAFTPGRHVRYGGSPPTANLWASILNALGGNVTSFGDGGNGTLDQL